MDLGIADKTALLCASNAGLGLACAKALAAEGVHVVINGRNADKTAKAVAEIETQASASVSSPNTWFTLTTLA